jgi:hypothetical protein
VVAAATTVFVTAVAAIAAAAAAAKTIFMSVVAEIATAAMAVFTTAVALAQPAQLEAPI